MILQIQISTKQEAKTVTNSNLSITRLRYVLTHQSLAYLLTLIGRRGWPTGRPSSIGPVSRDMGSREGSGY